MDRAQLLTLFCNFATEIAEKDFSGTTSESNISGMGIDSLQILEIVGTMERELKVEIPDDQLVGIETVGELLGLVESKLAD